MDKLSLLESVPIFSDLSKSDLTKISDRMTQRTFTKNQMILLEDDLGKTFFVISKGEKTDNPSCAVAAQWYTTLTPFIIFLTFLRSQQSIW